MTTKALAAPNPPQPSADGTLGRYVRRQAVTLKTSAAETASYTTDDGIKIEAVQLSLNLNLTASTSPTSLNVDVQGSADGTNWFKLGSFAQLGAVATGNSYFEGAGAAWVRYVSTIVGTSYTYSITGTYRY